MGALREEMDKGSLRTALEMTDQQIYTTNWDEAALHSCVSVSNSLSFCALLFGTPWERMEKLFDLTMNFAAREYRFEKFGDGRFIAVVYRILFDNGVKPS